MLKSSCIKVTTTIKWLPVDSSLLRMISSTLTALLQDPDIQILSPSRDSVEVDTADQNCYWWTPKIICISNFPSMSKAHLHPTIVLSFPFPPLPASSFLVISVLRLLGRSGQGGIYVWLSLGKPWQPEQGPTKVRGGVWVRWRWCLHGMWSSWGVKAWAG